MTLQEAKTLKPGDRVMWHHYEDVYSRGAIQSLDGGGIVVQWDDDQSHAHARWDEPSTIVGWLPYLSLAQERP